MILSVGITGELGIAAIRRRDDPPVVVVAGTRCGGFRTQTRLLSTASPDRSSVAPTHRHDHFTGRRAAVAPHDELDRSSAVPTVDGSGSSSVISTVELVF